LRNWHARLPRYDLVRAPLRETKKTPRTGGWAGRLLVVTHKPGGLRQESPSRYSAPWRQVGSGPVTGWGQLGRVDQSFTAASHPLGTVGAGGRGGDLCGRTKPTQGFSEPRSLP